MLLSEHVKLLNNLITAYLYKILLIFKYNFSTKVIYMLLILIRQYIYILITLNLESNFMLTF